MARLTEAHINKLLYVQLSSTNLPLSGVLSGIYLVLCLLSAVTRGVGGEITIALNWEQAWNQPTDLEECHREVASDSMVV